MQLTYLGHSGFCLTTRRADFLMDCIGGYRRGPRPVAALVSHEHADHWQPEAVACADVLVRGMAPGETREIYGARIRAYGSTDEGVSFLIQVEGRTLFHAGDLNFWHWAEESTPEEVAQARRAYDEVLSTLQGEKIHVAMFPVDPRMGRGFARGAELFLQQLQPERLIPMHFWGRPEVAWEFARRQARVTAMTAPGSYLML